MSTVESILLAGGIMLALAVVFGVILVVVSNALAVKKDERAEQVEKLLANSNCGGCGYAGCAQFAAALVKGEAKLSDCKATPAAKKQQIAELLGGGDAGEDTVAVVHCSGGNGCYNKYDYQGLRKLRRLRTARGRGQGVPRRVHRQEDVRGHMRVRRDRRGRRRLCGRG